MKETTKVRKIGGKEYTTKKGESATSTSLYVGRTYGQNYEAKTTLKNKGESTPTTIKQKSKHGKLKGNQEYGTHKETVRKGDSTTKKAHTYITERGISGNARLQKEKFTENGKVNKVNKK